MLISLCPTNGEHTGSPPKIFSLSTVITGLGYISKIWGTLKTVDFYVFVSPNTWVILVGNTFDGPFWDILAELLGSPHGMAMIRAVPLLSSFGQIFFLKWPATF